ncbi:hypothetical protein [Serratia sp. 14-2641]|uniref:hypothetical protein n=1 Tax=Serratia sp. 14-2641 TaxID=1841657 RepID=UPI00080FE6D7|nr:hypothetical protein [Serratia sp. 14-2641]OCJ22810.1 hypothetical protein A6U95_13620 [Serratia sp. 14-2641]
MATNSTTTPRSIAHIAALDAMAKIATLAEVAMCLTANKGELRAQSELLGVIYDMCVRAEDEAEQEDHQPCN